MSVHPQFAAALELLEHGRVDDLRELLRAHPDLAMTRDEGGATLLIRLVDWPGHRPRSAESAKALLEAGAEVDARRNDENGTPLGGALCTEEVPLVRVLLEHGADVHAPCGWRDGSVLDFGDALCEGLQRRGDETMIALSEALSAAAGRPVPPGSHVGGPIPLVFVTSVDDALRFYTEVLGFRVLFVNVDADGDKYVGIVRGDTDLHLTMCGCDDERHRGNLDVRIACDPVDPLFVEFRDAGATIRSEPRDQPWGFREFEIEDPDGNRFTFHGPTIDD